MTPTEIVNLRLRNQQIAGAESKMPFDVVSRLGALQAQDYAGAKWAIGLRSNGLMDKDIEQALAERKIVRTWPMRGTLHFVAPENVRWMLDLLTPRVVARATRRHKQLELNEDIFERSRELFTKALKGDKHLTRNQMMKILEKAGIKTTGQRGYHILWFLAQSGLICFGPVKGRQQTFVLLDEWIPESKKLTRDESLAEITRIYFKSHGPATFDDFVRWTGLLVKDARRGLEVSNSKLIEETIGNETYWMMSDIPASNESSSKAYLLPGFDEYLIGYKDRSAMLDPQYSDKVVPWANGMFSPVILINGRVQGTWRRSFQKGKVVIEINPFSPLNKSEKDAVATAAERFSEFVGMPLHYKEV